MPFQETKAIEQRVMFVTEVESSGESLSNICARYTISRVTGYKWLERYEEEGVEGLWERSRAPHHIGHGLDAAQQRLILEARRAHPRWGPRKLLVWLKVKDPQRQWCAASTIGELLRREGLNVARVYRRRSVPRIGPLEPYERANQVWCTDFKGWFVLGNRQRCEPWTLSDGWSRYLLRVQALHRPELQAVRRGFEAAFREYGLPKVIRSDNGRPFAGLGIRPERIGPGRPQENGRHERMHLTLQEVIERPARTLRGQQGRFQAFRQEFNQERPHEALGQRTPASVYRPSPRPYPTRLPNVEYEQGIVIKGVHQHGDIRWQGQRVFLNQALAGEEVGFQPLSDGLWLVRFGSVRLAKWDERKWCFKALEAKEVTG